MNRTSISNALTNAPDQRKNTLYQVSLLQGLTSGDYYGSVAIEELKQHGDVGIGTFDGLNGELIMLNGEVYRAKGDGRIEVVSDLETTPFAVAAFMNTDGMRELKDIRSCDALFEELERMVEARGKNRFYMIRIDGVFREIEVRSVPKQKEPFKRLVEVLESEQTLFRYKKIEGTMVGLYCPCYMSALNAVGWHLHFISKDRTVGGHVLDVDIAEAVSTWTDLDAFEVRLPKNGMFDGLDLAVDQSRDIEKVEKNR